MMPQSYTPEFKKKIIRLRLEEGRTIHSITTEYGISKETLRLRKELAEKEKEILFLKKSGGILCKGNRLEAYRFIEQYHNYFGVRWLLRHLDICPNAYYNYRKRWKADYYTPKSEVQLQIRDIYHKHKGVDGYRNMIIYLARREYHYSQTTIHKYMNTEMKLYSVVRPKKPGYGKGKLHKVFENKLRQDFTAEKPNQKWCTDFTYLFLKNHETRNCTILDIYDRSVIASITDRNITSELATRTLKKALESQPSVTAGLMLHSDQGTQYTSRAFTEFCESINVTQSMSKAGCPYDNALMERSFDTLKNECTNLYEFASEEAVYQKVEEFAYVDYNHVRPHSFNGYRTSFEARNAA